MLRMIKKEQLKMQEGKRERRVKRDKMEMREVSKKRAL